jgi:hypothetical protein
LALGVVLSALLDQRDPLGFELGDRRRGGCNLLLKRLADVLGLGYRVARLVRFAAHLKLLLN